MQQKRLLGIPKQYETESNLGKTNTGGKKSKIYGKRLKNERKNEGLVSAPETVISESKTDN